MKKFIEDFKAFITRGNVVDMAVGVAVAGAFTAIVTAFTKGFITPLLALLTNNSDLTEMKWVVRPEVTEVVDGATKVVSAEVALFWGAFAQKIIDFLIIAFVLFLIMRIASAVMARSAQIRASMMASLNKEEAEKKAAEEAAAKAAEEAQKAEAEKKAAEEAAKLAAEEERRKQEIALLMEIRDLLKK